MAKKSKKNISYNLHGNKLYHEKARLILPILVQLATARNHITYGHLAGILPDTHHRNLNYPLGSIGTSINELSKQLKLKIPPIQCLVVNKAEGLPGEGWWLIDNRSNLYKNRPKNDKKNAVSALHKKIYDFKDWPTVLNKFDLQECKNFFATDISTPPEKVKCVITRIVRDSALARRVKEIYDFQCQICLHFIALPDDKRYAEAHHIKPLGKPHNGPDKKDNIICLCPNCHAAVDLGAIKIRKSKLTIKSGHVLNKNYLKYHNQKIYKNS